MGWGTGSSPTSVPCWRNLMISDSSVKPLKNTNITSHGVKEITEIKFFNDLLYAPNGRSKIVLRKSPNCGIETEWYKQTKCTHISHAKSLCVFVCVRACVRACVRECMRAYVMYVVRVCECMRVCMCVCMRVCVYVRACWREARWSKRVTAFSLLIWSY